MSCAKTAEPIETPFGVWTRTGRCKKPRIRWGPKTLRDRCNFGGTSQAIAKYREYSAYTHTHTHPFNGPFSGTTRVSRYQKSKPNLDFTKARDSESSGISWAICKSAPSSRQITTPATHHSVFYRPDALPAAQPTASKHLREIFSISQSYLLGDRSNVSCRHQYC